MIFDGPTLPTTHPFELLLKLSRINQEPFEAKYT